MLLGKRQRPPIRRTTSMTQFSADLELSQDPLRRSDHETAVIAPVTQQLAPLGRQTRGDGNLTENWRQTVAAIVSPRPPRRNSADLTAMDTAPFLRSCGLCNRRLAPGRDIFMYRFSLLLLFYRGEIAFCSIECRQQQMNHDEKKEKSFISSIKDSAPAATATSDPSSTAETMAVA